MHRYQLPSIPLGQALGGGVRTQSSLCQAPSPAGLQSARLGCWLAQGLFLHRACPVLALVFG